MAAAVALEVKTSMLCTCTQHGAVDGAGRRSHECGRGVHDAAGWHRGVSAAATRAGHGWVVTV